MGKAKFTDETLVNKCSSHACKYNKMDFCLLPTILVGEDGKCIYYTTKEDEDNGKAKEDLG